MTDGTHSLPLDEEPLTQDVPPMTEPLGALVAILPQDPLIGDLIALRRAKPDLAEAARSAAFFEAMLQVRPHGVGFERLFGLAEAGLQLLGAANEAIVAIGRLTTVRSPEQNSHFTPIPKPSAICVATDTFGSFSPPFIRAICASPRRRRRHRMIARWRPGLSDMTSAPRTT